MVMTTDSQYIYSSNSRTNKLEIFDTVSGSVVSTISLPNYALGIFVSGNTLVTATLIEDLITYTAFDISDRAAPVSAFRYMIAADSLLKGEIDENNRLYLIATGRVQV